MAALFPDIFTILIKTLNTKGIDKISTHLNTKGIDKISTHLNTKGIDKISTHLKH